MAEENMPFFLDDIKTLVQEGEIRVHEDPDKLDK